ncbi:MAG: hypothetical protein KatS3mg113_1077 [Planctomycetaceae bacterium]|nr:MAG: hypothetical protein KatS3mg113_1077 [Planctomycetaceae bacterium]
MHNLQLWLRPLKLPGLGQLSSIVFLLSASLLVSAQRLSAQTWQLLPHDRIVVLGASFVEREALWGEIETTLTSSFADRPFTLRWLGWSGDTVWAESRGVFDPPVQGYRRMLDLVQELGPTVVVLAYGQNEMFAGEEGLPRFLTQYEQLCRDLSAEHRRLVLVVPHLFESPAPPLPDAARWNPLLRRYGEAIKELAHRLQTGVIDLQQETAAKPLTDNGMHLTREGYRVLGKIWVTSAGGQPRDLPAQEREHLRQLIVIKNTWFFHRWRPANVTYLYLFRKHEQGNNAVEIPQFDPFVEQTERQIWDYVTRQVLQP